MNPDLPLWMQLILGLVAIMAIFAFWPGIKAGMEQSRKAENKDWAGLIFPLGLVVLFVVLLVQLV